MAEESNAAITEYEVKLISMRKNVKAPYELADVGDANEIISIPKWKRRICKQLTKVYTRCVGLRNGYLRHYHGDGVGDLDPVCNIKTFRKYRPNLQYKLVHYNNAAAKNVEKATKILDVDEDEEDESEDDKSIEEEEDDDEEFEDDETDKDEVNGKEGEAVENSKEQEEDVKIVKEDCVLALCHIIDSGNKKERKKLVRKMQKMSDMARKKKSDSKLMEEIDDLATSPWIFCDSTDQTTVLHFLVLLKSIQVLEMLLKAPTGLMIPPSKEADGDDEDELQRREIMDFLSRQDRYGDTALHNLSDSWDFYKRVETQTVTRLFTDFCYHTIDMDTKDKKAIRSHSNIPFINRLLSIRSLYRDGRTVLTMLLYDLELLDVERSSKMVRQERLNLLNGFLDAMQSELMRQGRQLRLQINGDGDKEKEEEEEGGGGGGVDVSWLLTADEDEKGRTPFHYKCKRVVQILPPKHLRPHNFFKLCTAKDALNGSTPLHELRSQSDAQFCSAVAILSKQLQAVDDERRRHHSSSAFGAANTRNNNIAINIVSSHKTAEAAASIWKDGTSTVEAIDDEQASMRSSANVSTTSVHPSVHRMPKATVDDHFLHAVVHARDDDGRTPLHTAEGSSCINALLRFGASVAEPDREGNDALTSAFEGLFEFSQEMMMKSMSGGGGGGVEKEDTEASDLKVKHRTCDSLLQWACPLPHDSRPINGTAASARDGALGAKIEQMALGGVPTWIINKRIGRLGLTALHMAAGIGSSMRVEKLLKKGAYVNVRCSGGRTPLHMATSHGLRLLASFDDLECSPLDVIRQLTFCDEYDRLFQQKRTFFPSEHEPDMETIRSQLKSNLQLGLMMRRGSGGEKAFWQELARTMLEYIDTQDFSGQTCLHNLVGSFGGGEELKAQQKKVTEILQHCIQKLGCRVHLGNRAGDTLLHVAVARCKDAKMVEDIIEWASFPVAAASLMIAAGSSRVQEEEGEVIKKSDWLLMGNASEETALHVAVRKGRMEMVEVLLKAAAEDEDIKEMLWRRKDVLEMTAVECMGKEASSSSSQGCSRKENDMSSTMGSAGSLDACCCCCWKHLKEEADSRREIDALDPPRNVNHIQSSPANGASSYAIDATYPPHERRPLRLVAGPQSQQQSQHHHHHIDDDPLLDLQKKLSDQPTLTDELNRYWLVKGIVDLLLNPLTSTPITIGILGNWGAGKTSFMKQVEALALYLNTPEKERRNAWNGTVDMSPGNYNMYKAKAFLSGVRKHSDRHTTLVPMVTTCHDALQRLVLKRANSKMMKDRPKVNPPKKYVSIVTIWYNAWQYDGKMEASAGLALEVCKELEGLMTLCQWMRMRCAYAWKMNQKGVVMSLIVPTLLATGLIILALTLVKVLHVPLSYGASMGVLGVVGVLFKAVKTVAPPVSKAMTAYMSTTDHSSMLGYQHRVIRDIQFLQEQLCARAEFPLSAFDLVSGYLSRGHYMQGTSIRKECPSKDNLRIIVFMDDIDRCDEKIVLELLRAINLVAIACGISVVLGANEQIIHDAILKEFAQTDVTCECITKVAHLIQSKSDGIPAISTQEDNIAERFMQKIIQIPVRIVEPGDNELWKFVQGVTTHANGVTNAMAETTQKSEMVTTKDSSDGAARNANATKVEVSIKVDSNEPGDAKKKTRKDSRCATSGKSNETKIEVSIKVDSTASGDAKKETTKDSSSDTNEKKETTKDSSSDTNENKEALKNCFANAQETKNGVGSPKFCGRALASHGIRLNTTTEYNILRDLIPLTHGDRRLPREWKRFMNYHQLARSVISAHHEQHATSKEPHEMEFKGWRRLLILWMFLCWNWKMEMKIIIQEWSDLTIEMKRQLPKDKASALLGDVIGYYMEKKGWKDKHDFYPIKVREEHIGDLQVLAWVKLYNTLRKRFDVPFNFIDMFQQFRYESNPLHISFDHEQ